MRLILVLIISFNLVDAQNLSNVTFGGSNSLDVISWNIENFPKNGQQTIDSVAVIIESFDADVIALQEIMNVSDFNNLLSLLPNYSGYCSSGSSRKMAFIYKSNLAVNNIYTIFSSQTYNFAGRAPIVISLNYNGENIEIINSHLKCCGDGILDTNDISDEENRRYRAMNMIKNYIDNNLQSSRVIFLGDLNDELQDPFANNVFRNIFLDSTNYYFADLYISNSSITNWSYPNWPSDIDHILVTNELFNYFTNSNVSTIRIDDYLVGGWSTYDNIISDHRPVGISLNFLISGCTDNYAVNYDPLATVDDSSCVYCDLSYSYGFSDPSSLSSCDGWIAITSVVTSNPPFTITWQNGSTQSYVFNLCTGNYIVNIQDDAGCNVFDTIQIGIFNGCTDSLAINYDPLATVDDGSCTYTVSCSSPSITGLGVSNVIHDRATLTFDDMNSSSCRVDQLRIKYRKVGTNAWNQKNMGSPTGYDPV
ncbi:endonuclease/exonuclease/phosphatase family protein, partial [Bacteroidota bacterium]|nr:endonuclease/exonuclease/phosphatase family protein [Bacteroidota bacterium]